jgi:hypothetical protein
MVNRGYRVEVVDEMADIELELKQKNVWGIWGIRGIRDIGYI